MAVRGLKSKIAVNVALMLLVSAILTDILVMLIAQGVLVRTHVNQQQKLLEVLGPMVVSPGSPSGDKVTSNTQGAIATLVAKTDFAAVEWLDHNGSTVYLQTSRAYADPPMHSAAVNALKERRTQHQKLGLVWAAVWWHAETVLVAAPLMDNGRVIGAGAAYLPLGPIYARLSAYHQPIVLYIVFNSVILTLAGLYRIFRIYLRPIDRMVQQADAYGVDEDFLFTFRREDNELNRLSLSLNRMLERIAMDKHKLQQSVTSLAKVNADLKQAQDEIIRAEKMASVGRLAAGIAHEIGNPIGIVLGYLDLLKHSDLEVAERHDFLQRSEKEIQRINVVIRQLLDLARPRQVEFRRLSVHQVICEFMDAMRSQPLLAAIKIQTRCEATRDQVWGDEDQLRQVLLNVVINAADAIHEASSGRAGTITMFSANEDSIAHPDSAGLIIGIRDTGVGIAPDQLQNIFDPFYTTKAPGKGTGLGLAVSYMIIEKMGGTMAAQSVSGQGTTMTIRLPLSAEPEKPRG